MTRLQAWPSYFDLIFIISSILQMRKLWLREIRSFAQGYTVSKWQCWDCNVRSLY